MKNNNPFAIIINEENQYKQLLRFSEWTVIIYPFFATDSI